MTVKRKAQQDRDGVWETTVTEEVDTLEYGTAVAALEAINVALDHLVAEGIERDSITFDIDKQSYYDGEIVVTHSVTGRRPSTKGEISNAKRTVTLFEHQREMRLREELAEIERRKAAKS